MNNGFILSKGLFDRLVKQDEDVLKGVYRDIIPEINAITGGDGYIPVYANFPASVVDMSYTEFFINAILYYWSGGNWRPEDERTIVDKFNIDIPKLTEIKICSDREYVKIFTDLVYANSSLSKFDKNIVEYFLEKGYTFDFNKVRFNETKAYIGRLLLNSRGLHKLPTKDATTVLRIWSAYCDGDEGLKVNTKFKQPYNWQKTMLKETLEVCYNLEEAFKTNREKFLKFLFYLNPLTKANKAEYPNLYNYTVKLRNSPKDLQTFAAKVEKAINDEDQGVFELLKSRMGVFTRRLDHLVRVFGLPAIENWLKGNPRSGQLLDAYNHFMTRDQKDARSAVLAGQGKSEVVNYKALTPLSKDLVKHITSTILEQFNTVKEADRKIWIDKALYFRPLATNNRAASLSLTSVTLGSIVKPEVKNAVRLFIHWNGRYDIDLSAMLITGDGHVDKVGWNGNHRLAGVAYSGDNTGHHAKNAEYIDINPAVVGNSGYEMIILDAHIYSNSPRTYKAAVAGNGGVHAGYMLVDNIQGDTIWTPKNLANASLLESESRTSYLLAYHIPTDTIIHLDVAKGDRNVSSTDEVLNIYEFAKKFLISTEKVSWKKLYQGHLLELTAGIVVEDPKDADVIFSENTTSEEVSTYL